MEDNELLTTGLHVCRRGKARIGSASVIGERSSGTNFCSFLMRENFGLEDVEATGWKHGPGTGFIGVPADHLFVVCFRNALSWVRSMYAKPWHCAEEMYAPGLSHFLRAPWDTRIDKFLMRRYKLNPKPRYVGQTLGLDRHPLTGEMFRNVCEVRTVKAQSFLALEQVGVNVAFVRLEVLQKDTEEVLDRMAEAFSLARPKRYQVPARGLGRYRGDGLDVRRAEAATLSPEDRAFVLSELDHEVERRMGYVYEPGA